MHKVKKHLLLAGILLSGLVAVVGIIQNSEKTMLLALPAFFLPFVLNYFYLRYEAEERKRKIEEEVPDVLLVASSLPEAQNISKVVGFAAKNSNGPIAEEFSIANSEITAGMPVEEALARISRRNNSASLERAIGMLVAALDSGANMASAFRETAEDFMETSSVLRERAASTALQKYTMLAASAFLVPFILGKLASLVQGFSLSTLPELGIGMAENQRREILSAAGLGNIVYIAELAVIASLFIAFQEGNQKKAIVYAIFLLPLALGTYFVSVGGL